MSPTALCAIMLAAAIDFGYEPMDDGGVRYLIRIEPHMVDVLHRGQVLGSVIPPEVVGRVRAFRVYSSDEVASKEVPPELDAPASGPADFFIRDAPEIAPPFVPREPPETDDPRTPAVTLSPSEEIPRHLPDSENVKHALAIAPGGPAWLDEEQDVPELDAETPKPPYLPLVFAILAAAGSSSGMLWFGWLAFDYRARYRALLREVLNDDHPGVAGIGKSGSHGSGRDSTADSLSRRDTPRKARTATLAEEPPWHVPVDESDGGVRGWLEGDEKARPNDKKDPS